MRIGAVLPTTEIGDDPAALKDFAQAVETMGFAQLLIYDHVLGADPDRPGGWDGPYTIAHPFHEVFVTLGYLAALTQTIELATCVLVLPQRQTALAAKQAAQLAVLSDNRFRLGIGSGWNRVEYEALKENFRNRGRRQEEQVALMRRLWSEEVVAFEGEFHTVSKAGIAPRPTRPIPVWFGGTAEPQLKRAASIGDGWFPGAGPSEEAAAQTERVRGYLADAGRDPAAFGIGPQAQFHGGNPELWRRHAERWEEIGATEISIATMNAELSDVDDHIAAVRQYKEALGGTG